MRLDGPVDLPATLHGGQAFRWVRADDGSYEATLGERVVRLRALPGQAVEAGAKPRAGRAFFERYFRFEPEDAARRERLLGDEALAPALRAMPGLRLLRQDPWETTVAFITSANNNVLRIEGILKRIASEHGAPLQEGYHAFPAPEALAKASEAQLRAIGLGYRAPFLREAARMIMRADVDLASIRGASWQEAREVLLRLPGVGPKVADCIALFSLDVDEAFPVDRWIAKAVSDTFFDGRTLKPRDITRFAHERWGRDAGLAQQYLFHLVRLQNTAPGVRRLSQAQP